MIPPKISVILPVYNAALYVNESIQSVLDQTFVDFELILINDGSTDESEEIILAFQDKRIRYYKNPSNLKLIDTLNLGLGLAQGMYIARIDADDIAKPERFQIQVDFLEANPTYGIVGSFAQKIGQSNDLLSYVEEDENIRYAFLTHNPFIHSTVMLRSSILKKHKLYFQKDKLHVEDYDLWIKLLHHTKGRVLPYVLIFYRVHSQQISAAHHQLQLENTQKIQIEYLISIGFDSFFSKLIISLLNEEKIPIDKLVKILSNLPLLGSIFPIQNHRNTFIQNLEKKIINQVLIIDTLSIRDLLLIKNCRNYFTFRQKLSLIIKTLCFKINKKKI